MKSQMKNFLKIIRNKRFVGISFCVILSFFTWLTAKLSMRYTDRITLKVSYTEVPPNLFIAPSSQQTIDVDIEGVGYSLLKYKTKKNVDIKLNINDLSNVGGNKFVLPKSTFNLIDYNILPDVNLKTVYPDTLRIDLQEYARKKVPVVLQMPIRTQVEYRLSELTISPDSVEVHALEHQLDTITGIYLKAPAKEKVREPFWQIFEIKNSENLRYNINKIKVNAQIIRVSEQELFKEIQVINVPDNQEIRLFPQKIKIIASGNVEILKSLQETDVVISADFSDRKNNLLPLNVRKKPEGIKIRLEKESVSYLIKEQNNKKPLK